MVMDLIKRLLKQNCNQELASLNGDLLINYAYFLLALFVGYFNLSPSFLRKGLGWIINGNQNIHRVVEMIVFVKKRSWLQSDLF